MSIHEVIGDTLECPDYEISLNPLDIPTFRKRCEQREPKLVQEEILFERDLAAFDIYHFKTHDTVAEIAKRFDLKLDRLLHVNGFVGTPADGTLLTLRC